MNAFTYLRLRFLEAWYDWFERQSRYVWDRSAERKKQRDQEEQAALARAINGGRVEAYSLGGGAYHYNATNSILGNTHSSQYGTINSIAPLTANQISTLTLNPTQGALNLSLEQSQPIQFTIHNATGGRVVEYIVTENGNRRTKLHVVTPEQDLGAALGKIITLELLRN